MIDPTVNFRSPTRYALPESSVKDNATIALADSAVQTRAHELYELRGRLDGRAEQDWVPSRNRSEKPAASKRSGLKYPQEL